MVDPIIGGVVQCTVLNACMQMIVKHFIMILWSAISLLSEVALMVMVTRGPQVLSISSVTVTSIAVVVVWLSVIWLLQKVTSMTRIVLIETVVGRVLGATII